MINNKIINFINNFSDNNSLVNELLVSAFVEVNDIKVVKNKLIFNLINSKKLDKEKKQFINLIKDNDGLFGFDDLIQLFELVIPSSEKISNGAVYTPDYIKQYIINSSISKTKEKKLEDLLFADISCGCGAFLFDIANKIRKITHKDFSFIFKDNIFGLDISQASIKRAEILLSLLALFNKEDANFKFNLFCGDALNFDWLKVSSRIKQNKGFDIIVGNPPYVRAKNLDHRTKKLMENWNVASGGNQDLYIPFFEIGLRYLNPMGTLGYITVNTFKKSVNARSLRKFFTDNMFSIDMIDFGSSQIFSKKATYTCLVFIKKTKRNHIKYRKFSPANLKDSDSNLSYQNIKYTSLDVYNGWLLNGDRINRNIRKIENAGKSLGERYEIKNGIATLRNDVYIFKPTSETKDFYILNSENGDYKIEKEVCRDIVKPNMLKSESQIPVIKEKIIFPYDIIDGKVSLITEKNFKKRFPYCYNFLSDNRKILENRDKGKKNYGEWFAFGRTQALNNYGFKLLFPYMANNPYFVFTSQKDLLIYCGYAIFGETKKDLLVLKKILTSDIFWYYIKHTSKPYSGKDYYALAKNYVKDFGICDLNDREKDSLLKNNNKISINKFLSKKYDLEYPIM